MGVTGPDPTPFPLDHLTRCGVRDAAALIVGEERLTYREMDEAVGRTASALLSRGLEPGDRVAIHGENRPEWVIADLAIQGIGAISVGVYPTSPAAEVEYLLDFIRSSQRGVILRRATRRAEEVLADD